MILRKGGMMKKLIVIIVTLVGALLLTGCKPEDSGLYEIWFDQSNEMITFSYEISRPSKDSETNELPIETITLEASHRDYEEWIEIIVLDDYSQNGVSSKYRFEHYGDYEFRIVVRNENGIIDRETDSVWIYISEPMYVQNFNAYFDQWNGEVHFDFNLSVAENDAVLIQKSTDGGLTWLDVVTFDVELDEFGKTTNQISYYEYNEGNYVYRITVFSSSGSFLGDMTTWSEIQVQFENQNFEGTPDINNVSASLDIGTQMVNIWWNSSGAFDSAIIEKSTDLVTWVNIGEVPRIGQFYKYQEKIDGSYYYRVSAVLDNTNVVSSESEQSVRVKDGALIGHFNGWINWNSGSNTISLDWSFVSDDVAIVRLERMTSGGSFEMVGDFGNLKTMHSDEALDPGSYTYRLTLFDEFDNQLDFMDSLEFVIESPDYVYSVNASHHQSTGKVQINFGVNQDNIVSYVIEQSSDGGTTWEEILNENLELFDDGGYKNYTEYYEINSGTYVYRMIGYDEYGKIMGSATTWNEIVVVYYLNTLEPTEMWNVDSAYDIYTHRINIWWNSQGIYESHLIEKSTDGIVWEEIAVVPRVASFFDYEEEEDGDYYYRVSAMDEFGSIIDTKAISYTVRVKYDAYIGSFQMWFDTQNQQFEVSWDMIQDGVVSIRLERKTTLETEFTVVSVYGPLKRVVLDPIDLSGTYQYRLVLMNAEGDILDEMISYSVDVSIIE